MWELHYMQSRNFFPFGINFNILVEPLYVISPNIISIIPPVSDYIITEDGYNIVMENGIDFIISE